MADTDPWAAVDTGDWAPSGADVHTPHAARIYDYALGGKDNYPADRELVEKLASVTTEARDVAVENRAFLTRAVRWLAAEAGIRQFIDVGSGLPTQSNVHEVAQEVDPDASVVYVDHDPIAVAHSREILSGIDNAVALQANVRWPAEILDHPKLRNRIRFDQPVAVLLVGLLHLVSDDWEPAGIVARFRDAMAPGSYLALCQITGDYQSPERVAQWIELFGGMAEPMVPRTGEQIRSLSDGFRFLDPGLVKASEWRPDIPSSVPNPETGWLLAGVGRKP